jgi:hypothetical protein
VKVGPATESWSEVVEVDEKFHGGVGWCLKVRRAGVWVTCALRLFSRPFFFFFLNLKTVPLSAFALLEINTEQRLRSRL